MHCPDLQGETGTIASPHSVSHTLFERHTLCVTCTTAVSVALTHLLKNPVLLTFFHTLDGIVLNALLLATLVHGRVLAPTDLFVDAAKLVC